MRIKSKLKYTVNRIKKIFFTREINIYSKKSEYQVFDVQEKVIFKSDGGKGRKWKKGIILRSYAQTKYGRLYSSLNNYNIYEIRRKNSGICWLSLYDIKKRTKLQNRKKYQNNKENIAYIKVLDHIKRKELIFHESYPPLTFNNKKGNKMIIKMKMEYPTAKAFFRDFIKYRKYNPEAIYRERVDENGNTILIYWYDDVYLVKDI